MVFCVLYFCFFLFLRGIKMKKQEERKGIHPSRKDGQYSLTKGQDEIGLCIHDIQDHLWICVSHYHYALDG